MFVDFFQQKSRSSASRGRLWVLGVVALWVCTPATGLPAEDAGSASDTGALSSEVGPGDTGQPDGSGEAPRSIVEEDTSSAVELSDEEQSRGERLQEAEREARRQLEEVRRAQEAEQDAQIRELIRRRRETLEEIADLAASHATRVQGLGTKRSEYADQFSRRQDDIDNRLRELPARITDAEHRRRVDRLFSEIRSYLTEARQDFLDALRQLRDARAAEQRARRRLETARESFQETEEQFGGVTETDIGNYRIELARSERDLAQRRRAMAEDVRRGWERLVELHRHRVDYYRRTLESLLPRISHGTWDDFFSPWKESNWEYAGRGISEALGSFQRNLLDRWNRVQVLPEKLRLVSFWGWLIGVLWRLALIPLVVYAIRRFREPAVRRIVDVLLSRAFFRRRADLTVKFVEVLASVVWPVAVYGLVRVNAAYLAQTFPEAQAVVAIADVGVIYIAAMSVVKVLVLTRSVRERLGAMTPAPGLGRWSDRSGHRRLDVVDVVNLEDERARKLVRSARRVVTYVLVSWFVPGWLANVIGYNLVWWGVSVGINWGALVILFIELRVWREEIAEGFERLASGRMATVANFVQRHQDRFYGVVLIAAASVILIIGEAVSFVRHQFVESEWSQRVGNFLFRKRIELQQRERDGEGEEDFDPMDLSRLPDDYRSNFASGPLYDETYLVERGYSDDIWEVIDEWRHRRKQGSLALAGEAGLGKSTLLNQVYRRLEEQHVPVSYVQLTDKLVEQETMWRFVADFFDLESIPSDREEMVEAVRNQPARVVIIDDCHHMYFRQIGGFRALARFLDLVNLTDDRHYWILSFNKFSWRYLDRVQEQKHFFGKTLELPPWNDEEIQALINRRNESLPYSISFQELVVARDEELRDYYEVVQTANGYFRLLEEFCDGNPSVAMEYWLRNLSVGEDNVLKVSLFRKPTTEPLESLTDNHLFALTALAQHGSLFPGEVADIINAEAGFCEMAMTHFEQVGIVEKTSPTGRYTLTSLYFRPVVNHLSNSNFLWM